MSRGLRSQSLQARSVHATMLQCTRARSTLALGQGRSQGPTQVSSEEGQKMNGQTRSASLVERVTARSHN